MHTPRYRARLVLTLFPFSTKPRDICASASASASPLTPPLHSLYKCFLYLQILGSPLSPDTVSLRLRYSDVDAGPWNESGLFAQDSSRDDVVYHITLLDH
jgi:hypothetical protein